MLGVSGTCIRQLCIDHNIGDKIGNFIRVLSDDEVEQIKKIRDEQTGRPEGALTIKEVAKELDVTVSRIRQLCLEHRLGEVKGQVKYLSQDEVGLLKKNRRRPGRPKSEN